MSIKLLSKKKYLWYPPAETNIPWPVLLCAIHKQHQNFKRELREYLSVKNCILANSARALLFKLLSALKKNEESQRNEVLIPGYTCYSVPAAIVKAGLKIAVYDLDPKTLQPDIESVNKAISEKTLAVVTQHLFGLITPLDEIINVSHKKGAYLIEDAAQALGRDNWGNRLVISGDFGLFSFGRGKPLPIGNGGALAYNKRIPDMDSIEIGPQGNGLKHVAFTAATKIASHHFFYWIPEMLPLGLGETVFDADFNIEGMTDSTQAMLVNAIPFLDGFNEHRRHIANVYELNIDPDSKNQIIKNNNCNSIIRYPILLSKNTLTKELKRLGVRRMYPNAIVNENKIAPYLVDNPLHVPIAIEIAEKLFTLPTHTGIDESLAIQISNAIRKFNR
jgi:dTDP-4-amino-4,6-dideoxygalactose transaminase